MIYNNYMDQLANQCCVDELSPHFIQFRQTLETHLTKKSDDPFFIVNLDEVDSKHKLWKKLLPRVEPHYAVKCNNDPVVLERLVQLGVGFDCASMNEIEQILHLGVSSSRIVYAHPCKQVSFLEYAKQNDINLMTFDNEDELHKIKKTYPDARLLLRVLSPEDILDGSLMKAKFGCHPNDVINLFSVSQQLELNIVGVSYHIGHTCFDRNIFVKAVELARRIFDIGLEKGFTMNILDIGGGFPGIDSGRITTEEICEVLVPALDTHFPSSSGVRIIAEPGRFFVTAAFTLCVNVIGKKKVYENSSKEQNNVDDVTLLYHLNDGLFGSFHPQFSTVTIKPLADPQRYSNSTLYKSSLWGPTCFSFDCVIPEIILPEMSLGDWLLFLNMGAYTSAASTTFNGMPRPSKYYINSNTKLAL